MTYGYLLQALLLSLAVGALVFWWTSARARELAVGHARRACRAERVQFLDQSVSLLRLRPGRSPGGNSVLRREFGFEFTSHGDYRDTARVMMLGHALVGVRFPYTRDADGNRIFLH